MSTRSASSTLDQIPLVPMRWSSSVGGAGGDKKGGQLTILNSSCEDVREMVF